MGLYDDRMDALSESRRTRASGNEHPYPKSAPPFARSKEARKSMQIQSLLFSRDSWTVAKAKKWAKDNGYKYGKVDVTDEYIRIRQLDPKKFKVKRTITLGRGIRAVVAREENMAKAAASRRRRSSTKKKRAPKKRSTRRRTKARATSTRRRKKRASAAAAAPRRRKKTTRRRRRSSRSEAWYGDTAGHRRAAKKGVRRRKRRQASRKRRSTREAPVAAAPRRRRRKSAPRRTTRRRSYASAPRRRSNGMGVGEFLVAVGTAGVGYVLADGLDRFLATYNPAETDAEKRAKAAKDKFTSPGAGTLANTLNIASAPGVVRAGVAVAATAVPAVASMYVGNKYAKSALQGVAIGAGVSGFKMLFNNVVMPMLKPKDTSAASLQKSYIARLYPSEVAASVNHEQKQKEVSSGGGAGALSDKSDAGVGKPADVGPFALQGDPAYPDAAQALRKEAGMGATPGNKYPTVQDAMGTSGDGDFPTASQAMSRQTGQVGQADTGNPGQPGVSQEPAKPWAPGPPPLPGPGPQAAPGEDPACGCISDGDQYLGFIGDKPTDDVLLPSLN